MISRYAIIDVDDGTTPRDCTPIVEDWDVLMAEVTQPTVMPVHGSWTRQYSSALYFLHTTLFIGLDGATHMKRLSAHHLFAATDQTATARCRSALFFDHKQKSWGWCQVSGWS